MRESAESPPTTPAADSNQKPGSPPADTQKPASPPKVDSELAGTAWRLVEIQSMDDSVYRPDDPTKYTVRLQPDGVVQVRADCNRGHGPWKSERAGHLEMGPLATTRAQCPPASLSERFLSDLKYTRSYVLKNGRIFMATMADGAILEFDPIE